jgi:UDP-glucose 4-epimerase
MKKKRLLLFGKNGFISKNLSNYFNKKNQETLTLSSKEYNLTKRSTIVKLKKIIKHTDILIFTPFIFENEIDNDFSYSKNILMLEIVLASIHKIKKFIYLSSDAVYDVDKMPLDEDSVCNPIDSYGALHLAREKILRNFFKDEPKKLTILRLTSVYGFNYYRENYGPSLFIRRSYEKNKISLFGDGEEKRSHIYIDDLMEIIFRIIKSEAFGFINIASTPVSFEKIARVIKNNMECKILIKKVKRIVPVVRNPYKWSQIFRYIYNFGVPINQIYHKSYKLDKLRKYTNNYVHTSIENGIIKTINDYKKKYPNTCDK